MSAIPPGRPPADGKVPAPMFPTRESVRLARLRERVARVSALAASVPNNHEGSAGHLRNDFAWQLADDMRRLEAGEQSILSELAGESMADAMAACIADANGAIERWQRETRSIRVYQSMHELKRAQS